MGKRGQDEDDDDDDDTAANGPAKTADEIADEINTVFYDKDYYGLFNPGDIKPLFHDPNEPEEPSATQSRFNPFITKLYRLVSKQSEPEEAIVDVLDKVSMLLKIKKCAFPDEIQDAPRKDIFTYIVKEQASDDTRKDIIDLFGKARDDTRPYTAGRTKNMKEVRLDEERSDSKSNIPPTHTTNNLLLVTSLLTAPRHCSCTLRTSSCLRLQRGTKELYSSSWSRDKMSTTLAPRSGTQHSMQPRTLETHAVWRFCLTMAPR